MRAPIPRGDHAFLDASKDYPAQARALGIGGVIRVLLVVDAQGKVTRCSPINNLGYGLDELALRRAAEIEFEPAVDTDGTPVASAVVWTFDFRLDSPKKPDAPASE